MAGAVLGWNWRVSQQFVLGIEADWIFTGVSVSETVDDVTIRASADHLVSLRARAGVPLGPALIYVTGGPAWQNAKVTLSDGEGSISDREWQLGGAFGGGAEVELTRAFAVRLEALRYIFPNDGAPLSEFLDSENQHTTVRVGGIVKLN
jgi:opacity protein-like surface antigen